MCGLFTTTVVATESHSGVERVESSVNIRVICRIRNFILKTDIIPDTNSKLHIGVNESLTISLTAEGGVQYYNYNVKLNCDLRHDFNDKIG